MNENENKDFTNYFFYPVVTGLILYLLFVMFIF